MHQLSLGESLAGVAVTCIFYALALSTPAGQRWATAKTWTTVVLGDILVLAWVAAYNWHAAIAALPFFVVGGLPIVIRSLWLEYVEQESIHHRENNQ
jgi:hypothetical protein